MQKTEGMKQQYESLEWSGPIDDESVVQSDSLLTFPYEYPGSDTEVSIDTDEFTAVCPWTGLPDFGALVVTYVPGDVCLELKSVKYYLLAYRSVGIVQEHAANRILNDLTAACSPRSMTLTLDYNTRGGLHTVVTAHYPVQ
ncbi:MAG: NADPH-dependent 7-cyano-7-deazaguanine reductase QueF [SAR202 cluster bacterium]|nr:NADPH-dependent 7-cyano-7-deazaguanine reductase QueF [SAR202 cluster bacterium]|tara:strand:+ start:2173 stop:2595 length:423 start_codon:yes stop_codon:yes gene_type:complete